MARTATQRTDYPPIVAHSERMRALCETAERLAQFDTTALITGESGTGKELLARWIHQCSPRNSMPFVAINCGAIPENLIESELFGYRRGAFTNASHDKKGLFEEAEGGTLFLDEIGDLPLSVQVKILRALQERNVLRVGDTQPTPINVRIVAATLKDLSHAVRVGEFREDLFYRLNVVALHLSPLRERVEDVPPLIEHFLEKQRQKHSLSSLSVDKATLDCLLRYEWPGNIRELENCIERAAVLTKTNILTADLLPEHIAELNSAAVQKTVRLTIAADDLSIKKRSQNLEVDLIAKALVRTRGNHTRAAKLLEISHRALLYKLKEYGFSLNNRQSKRLT